MHWITQQSNEAIFNFTLDPLEWPQAHLEHFCTSLHAQKWRFKPAEGANCRVRKGAVDFYRKGRKKPNGKPDLTWRHDVIKCYPTKWSRETQISTFYTSWWFSYSQGPEMRLFVWVCALVCALFMSVNILCLWWESHLYGDLIWHKITLGVRLHHFWVAHPMDIYNYQGDVTRCEQETMTKRFSHKA